MQAHSVAGYEHIEAAAEVLSAVVADLFALPGAAQQRAVHERDRLGEEGHGDDLLCGCWAAHESATALLELSGRHIDGLLHLAAQHPAFAPTANVLARAALDGLLRTAWLLSPQAPPDREQRWIALKHEEARFFHNVGAHDDAAFAATQEELTLISAAIGGQPVPGTPSSEAMASELASSPDVYRLFYRWGSQPTHGTLVGAGTFDMEARTGWNEAGGDGEWVEAEFWSMPMTACWEAAKAGLPVYRDLLAPDHELPSLDREQELFDALRAVPANYQAAKALDLQRPPAANRLNRAQRRAMNRNRR